MSTPDRVIPSTPSDVTPRWLESVLRAGGQPVTIGAVRVAPIGTGQTGATFRITVDYVAPRPALPDRFVVKLPSQDAAVRERVALGYRCEHAFYTDVVDTVRVPTPRFFHCDVSDNGFDFVLLLEDLTPAKQGDQIRGCSVDEARLAVRALAGLHGPRWNDPAWSTFTGTVMPLPDRASADGLGAIAKMAADTTLGHLGDTLSDADRQTVTEAMARVADWLLTEPNRFTLLHGDFRLDNLLFDPDRTRVAVVDWQTIAVGLPTRDLAYFLGTSLQPEARARSERALVADYHRALCSYGVSDYGIDTCWNDYRLGALQIPLITTLGFAFSAATDRGDDMVRTMLERGARAIRELETLALIA